MGQNGKGEMENKQTTERAQKSSKRLKSLSTTPTNTRRTLQHDRSPERDKAELE